MAPSVTQYTIVQNAAPSPSLHPSPETHALSLSLTHTHTRPPCFAAAFIRPLRSASKTRLVSCSWAGNYTIIRLQNKLSLILPDLNIVSQQSIMLCVFFVRPPPPPPPSTLMIRNKRDCLFLVFSQQSESVSVLNQCLQQAFYEDAAETLVTSYILSRLDYCNCLLMGTPYSVIQPLQKIQNFAARLILLAPCQHLSWKNCTGFPFQNVLNIKSPVCVTVL